MRVEVGDQIVAMVPSLGFVTSVYGEVRRCDGDTVTVLWSLFEPFEPVEEIVEMAKLDGEDWGVVDSDGHPRRANDR